MSVIRSGAHTRVRPVETRTTPILARKTTVNVRSFDTCVSLVTTDPKVSAPGVNLFCFALKRVIRRASFGFNCDVLRGYVFVWNAAKTIAFTRRKGRGSNEKCGSTKLSNGLARTYRRVGKLENVRVTLYDVSHRKNTASFFTCYLWFYKLDQQLTKNRNRERNNREHSVYTNAIIALLYSRWN